MVQRFLSEEVTRHPSVLYVTLEVKDKQKHLDRYLSYYPEDEWEERREHFVAIRKIHDYLVETAKSANHLIIDSTKLGEAVTQLYSLSLKKLEGLFPEYNKFTKSEPFDESIIHS